MAKKKSQRVTPKKSIKERTEVLQATKKSTKKKTPAAPLSRKSPQQGASQKKTAQKKSLPAKSRAKFPRSQKAKSAIRKKPSARSATSKSYLDDLPERHETHELAEQAEAAFEAAVKKQKLFLIPRKDQYDYGSDYQLEARDGKAVTNLRAHVQLKGSDCVENRDGSISITVRRANLNYLLAPADSLYVCWHAPTKRLLVTYAAYVYREYEHQNPAWRSQAELTIHFRTLFDRAFQRRIHAHVLAAGRSNRDRRLDWIATPPEKIPRFVEQAVPLVEVSTDPREAFEVLQQLYAAGQDLVISHSFGRFEAVLNSSPRAMIPAYLAEINRGINSPTFDRERVRRAVAILEWPLKKRFITVPSGRYCQGNGWLALGELAQARDCFLLALTDSTIDSQPGLAAQCLKNLGSVFAGLGDHRLAYDHYQLALERDPHLAEAHMAVAICGLNNGLDPRESLRHLDTISAGGSAVSISSIQGWRIQILFKLGEGSAAFRELQALLAVAQREPWIWPYCAGQVAEHGRASLDTARSALNFWRAYLQSDADNPYARAEQLLCLAMLHSAGEATDMTFEKFQATVEQLSDQGLECLALLWDRAGHWAQDERDWPNAALCFRKAYDLEGGHYGYCLGVALNFLSRYGEALPLLEDQANTHQPDAMSWFQVGVARAGTGDSPGSIAAYQRAVELDPEYDKAWFNLGGMFWQQKDVVNTRLAWRELMRRFPDHELSQVVRRDFAFLFPAE